jgi:hypothetical protein
LSRLSTSGPRGLVYLMISWEPITTKENITSNILWVGEQLNILLMPVILMPCIGVVMLKSQRMVGVLLTSGVVGLDFDAWGCT